MKSKASEQIALRVCGDHGAGAVCARKAQGRIVRFQYLLAAYVRTVAKYPALNRFIAGQKIISRGEDIALCMTVKKEMRADAPDSVIKVHLHPADTDEQGIP